MNEFKQVFTQAQQFLLLQAYVDSKLSEAELMNFMLLETVNEIPVVFYSAGVMLIQPALDLDHFSHEFIASDQLKLRAEQKQLTILLSEKQLKFHFKTRNETEQVVKDLTYLYAL